MAKIRLIVLTILVMGGTIFTSVAGAQASTLHDVVPGGLPTNNANKAWSVLRERAEVDSGLASKLAEQSGTNTFNPNEFKPVGYHNGAPAGSVNSGISETGGVSSAQDTENCNVKSRMLMLINIQTSVKVFVCTKCSNPRLFHEPRPVFHKFSKGTVVHYHKTETKKFKICNPQIPVTVTATIKGVLRARTWGEVSGILKARLAASFKGEVEVKIKATCPVPSPPPPSPAPSPPSPPVTITQTTCPNGEVVASPASCNSSTNNAEQKCLAAGGSWDKVEQTCTIIQIIGNCSNVSVVNGSGNIVYTYQEGNCNTTIEEKPCDCEKHEPPTPSITITSMTSLNMIPEGKNSGPYHISVNASEPGGSLTVDPGIGSVSTCESSTPQESVTFFPLVAGNNNECVIFYAPSDSDKPPTMTVTATATLGNALSIKEDTFEIEYPTRP